MPENNSIVWYTMLLIILAQCGRKVVNVTWISNKVTSMYMGTGQLVTHPTCPWAKHNQVNL